jgi:hypothetical protein
LIDTLAPVSATEDEARALWVLWGAPSPTHTERQVFREALFKESAAGDYATPLGQRSSTIALARLHLSQSAEALSVAEVRRGMFFSVRPDGSAYLVPEALEPARRKWIVPQVRQLQRLALESLLSWCEQRIIEGLYDTAGLTAKLDNLLRAESFGLDSDEPLAPIISALDAQIASLAEFVSRGRTDALFSPFALMDQIQEAFRAKAERFAAVSFYGLLLCASFAGCFADNARAAIAVGGASRLSLFHLRKRLIALGGLSLRQAIDFVIESLVLSQHFATAVNRFDGENQRLRLSIEEGGLTSLAAKAWQPTITEDRLPTILDLAADCELIMRTGDAFRL